MDFLLGLVFRLLDTLFNGCLRLFLLFVCFDWLLLPFHWIFVSLIVCLLLPLFALVIFSGLGSACFFYCCFSSGASVFVGRFCLFVDLFVRSGHSFHLLFCCLFRLRGSN